MIANNISQDERNEHSGKVYKITSLSDSVKKLEKKQICGGQVCPPHSQLCWRLLVLAALVGAAHALITLAGVAAAVRTHVDGVELAGVPVAVMAAGGDRAMNRLVHHNSSILKSVVTAAAMAAAERLLEG